MIKTIFYCEFDPKVGPMILHQDPLIISKEIFDNNHFYFIPKPQLHGHIDDNVVIGYPIYIEDTKYDRNMLMFNICFVIPKNINPAHVEHIVKKFNLFAKDIEVKFGIISKNCKTAFFGLLNNVCDILNETGKFVQPFCNRILDLQIYKFDEYKSYADNKVD